MTLIETNIEHDARLRMQRSPATDPAYDATTHRDVAPAYIDRDSPYLGGADIVAVLVAAFMTLAPLAVAAYGISV